MKNYRFDFLRSGAFRKGPGAILEAPGTLPDQILRGFCDTFLQIACGSSQPESLLGFAGMLPESAPNLSNPLAGVPLGYGDSRSGLNSPYPNGVLGVLKQKRRQLDWKVYPSFPSRRPSADRRTSSSSHGKSPFFRFFSRRKKRRKKRPSKNYFFALFCDFGSPRRRFLPILGPKTDPRRLLFRCFFENGDFVKIVLLLVVGTRFCRLGPFKNRSRERVGTTSAKKT